jgi:cyclic di-GMP phosphodiesterase
VTVPGVPYIRGTRVTPFEPRHNPIRESPQGGRGGWSRTSDLRSRKSDAYSGIIIEPILQTTMTASVRSSTVNPLLRCSTVLVVDDEEVVRAFLERILIREGYAVEFATDGIAALSAAGTLAPDVVLLDVTMPGLDGFEVCRRLRQDTATRLTPVIIITALKDRETRIKGIEAGADDFLTKPFDVLELLARVRSLIRIKQYTDDLDSAASFIMALASTIETRDGFSIGHCSRIANYATNLGRALNVGAADLQALYRGGFLHDVGMLAIPDALIRKASPLEPDEYELVKSHTTVGDDLCSKLRSLQSVRPIVRSHHERLDGSGYPDGLRGDQIPLIAQILGVADVYESMTAPRPYQGTHSVAEALQMLRSHVDRGWRRPDLVEAFAAVVDRTSARPPTGSETGTDV